MTRSTTFFSSTVFVISILVFFLIRRQSSKLALKIKWYHSCGCCDDCQSCEQLKKHVTDKYFEKKLDLEPQSPSVTGKVYHHYNSWVTGVYMVYMFDRNSGGKTSQIEWLFESNLRSFGYFKYSAVLGIPWTPAAKAICLQELTGCFRPRLSPGVHNWTSAKNRNCIQILDTTLLLLNCKQKAVFILVSCGQWVIFLFNEIINK